MKSPTPHGPRLPKAFTLIELLVVISIIALLIGILLPSLQAARQSANSVTCLSRLRQIGQGLNVYAVDYKQSLPPGADGSTTNWAILIFNYLGASGSDFATQDADNSMNVAFRDVDTLETDDTTGHRIHYSSHPRLMPDINSNENFGPNTGNPRRPMTLDEVLNASDLIAIFDGVQIADRGNGVSPNGYGIDADRLFYDTFLVYGEGSSPDTRARAGSNLDAANGGSGNVGEMRFRHNNNTSGNVLYLDGHAGTIRYDGNNGTDLFRKNLNVKF